MRQETLSLSEKVAAPSDARLLEARERLDAQVREVVQWHFSPETGTPFWLERARQFDFDPLEDVNGVDDITSVYMQSHPILSVGKPDDARCYDIFSKMFKETTS